MTNPGIPHVLQNLLNFIVNHTGSILSPNPLTPSNSAMQNFENINNLEKDNDIGSGIGDNNHNNDQQQHQPNPLPDRIVNLNAAPVFRNLQHKYRYLEEHEQETKPIVPPVWHFARYGSRPFSAPVKIKHPHIFRNQSITINDLRDLELFQSTLKLPLCKQVCAQLHPAVNYAPFYQLENSFMFQHLCTQLHKSDISANSSPNFEFAVKFHTIKTIFANETELTFLNFVQEIKSQKMKLQQISELECYRSLLYKLQFDSCRVDTRRETNRLGRLLLAQNTTSEFVFSKIILKVIELIQTELSNLQQCFCLQVNRFIWQQLFGQLTVSLEAFQNYMTNQNPVALHDALREPFIASLSAYSNASYLVIIKLLQEVVTFAILLLEMNIDTFETCNNLVNLYYFINKQEKEVTSEPNA